MRRRRSPSAPIRLPAPTRARSRSGSPWRLGLVCAALLASSTAHAQAPPGTAEALRAELEQAVACYERIDYRCVIAALEGPVLVRRELPEGLSAQEIRLAHELLALGYLAIGLEGEAEQVFERLLELEPEYRLARPEAAPEHVALVERLAEAARLRRAARQAAQQTRERAALMASLPVLRPRAAAVAAAMFATRLAGDVRARAIAAAPGLADPPLGPLSGPLVAVAFAWRPMFGRDAQVFDHGFGVDTRLGLSLAPLYFGVVFDWMRHETVLANPVVAPPPPLDVFVVALEGGLRETGQWLGWSATLEAGGQYLHVSEALRAFNPHVAVVGDVRLQLGAGLGLRLGLSTGLIFGNVGETDEIGASVDLRGQLGLSWAP